MRFAAIDARLALAQQVEVRAVEHQYLFLVIVHKRMQRYNEVL